MPTSDDPRWARAAAYYQEGCELVELADQLWAKAHDPEIAADFRATWRGRYERVAARARTRFHRHDVLLTAADRARHEQLLRDRNDAAPALSALIPYASGLTRQENHP